MNTDNPKILKWFDRGKIKEAILGENSFFIPDVTFRERHDILLIFRQLFIWSDKNNKTFEVSKVIEEIICELSSKGNIGNTLDIVWCYLLTKREFNSDIRIDMNMIENELIKLVNKNSQELLENYELKELVLSISDQLPIFKKGLNL